MKNVLVQFLLDMLCTLATLGAPLVVGAIWSGVREATAHIKDRRVREFAAALVRSVEQKSSAVLTNDAKRGLVMTLLRQRFPRVPEHLFDVYLEAAVREMKSADPPKLDAVQSLTGYSIEREDPR